MYTLDAVILLLEPFQKVCEKCTSHIKFVGYYISRTVGACIGGKIMAVLASMMYFLICST